MRQLVRLTATIAIAATVAGIVPGSPALAGAGRVRDRRAMYRETNESRDAFGKADVTINRVMSKIARRHSAWMARTGNFQHTKDPGGTYLKGISWHCWGENIAVSGQSIPEIEKAFMKSPDHRANILNPCYKHVAVGVVRDDSGARWVTVFFYG